MILKQLSVFLENRPGHLSRVCDGLAAAGINIVTMTLADTRDFGILRLIIRDWSHAKEILDANGFAVKITDVMAIEVPDEPGGLGRILKIAEAGGLSVEYMYAFAYKARQNAQIIIRFENPDRACEVMKESKIGVLSAVEFYQES
jgi:hypothetical protein